VDDFLRNAIIAICAIIGTVVGLVTLWRTRRAEHELLTLRLRIGSAGEAGGVQITNESRFPVKIMKMRRVMRDGRREDLSFAVASEKGDTLPVSIEPRDTLHFRFAASDVFYLKAKEIQSLTVQTALGKVFTTGSSWRAAWRSAESV
jgi:hypothetical protein